MRIFAVLWLLALGCTSLDDKGHVADETVTPSGLHKIYVSSAELVGTLDTDNEVSVKVSGTLPSPAYTLKRCEVEVRDGTIEITPLATFNPDRIVAQILVPFEDSVKVKVQQPGDYTIRVNGRSEPVERQVVLRR